MTITCETCQGTGEGTGDPCSRCKGVGEHTKGVPFGALLREYRSRRKLSQARVGDIIGVTGTHVGEVERGRRDPFRVAQAIQISEALSFSPVETREIVLASVRDRGVVELAIGAGGEELVGLGADLALRWCRR